MCVYIFRWKQVHWMRWEPKSLNNKIVFFYSAVETLLFITLPLFSASNQHIVTMQSPSKSLKHEWRTKGTSTKSSITLAKVNKLKKKKTTTFEWKHENHVQWNTKHLPFEQIKFKNATEHSNDIFIFLKTS